MQCPGGYLCNQSHLGCRKDKEGTYLIAITNFAQESLGDILFVEIPDPGDTVAKSQTFGLIESAKVVSELVLPLGGMIVATNTELLNRPELINGDPYKAGWLLRIQPDDAADFAGLMDAQQYLNFCSGA